jgi:hypothetical protein
MINHCSIVVLLILAGLGWMLYEWFTTESDWDTILKNEKEYQND